MKRIERDSMWCASGDEVRELRLQKSFGWPEKRSKRDRALLFASSVFIARRVTAPKSRVLCSLMARVFMTFRRKISISEAFPKWRSISTQHSLESQKWSSYIMYLYIYIVHRGVVRYCNKSSCISYWYMHIHLNINNCKC